MKKLLKISILTGIFLLVSVHFYAQSLKTVKVAEGTLEGVEEEGLTVFKGVPFAAPPVGELRWKAPQALKKWEGVQKADKFGPACPQMSFFPTAKNDNSEDCLYLNIWTPAKSANEKLPVMVWIYGGGFAMGTTNIPSNYGDKLAKQGVILVSIAYRVGPLGFMCHPDLTAESPNKVSGNYGLLDQIAGLKWVQKNIAAFGGDPSKVTIFGESAGGISVSMLCASPLTKGLFRAAISESGGSFGPVKETRVIGGTPTLKGGEKQGVEFAKRMGVNSLAELRKLDPEKWMKDPGAQMGGFWPVVDGYVITDDQYKLYEKGIYNDINVIIGTNSDEGAMFVRPSKPDDYKKYVEQTFGKFAGDVLKLYPGNTEQETYTSQADIFRETAFAWPSWTWARLQRKTGKSNVFVYYFDQQQPQSPWMQTKLRGASHAYEVGFVFNHLDQNATENDQKLSAIMSKYWTNFAKTGDPNGEGLPKWPLFEENKASVLNLNDNIKTIEVPNSDKLQLMDEFFKWKRESN